MRIGVAQIRPVPGNIAANIDRHQELIHPAIADRAELIDTETQHVATQRVS